MSLQMLITGEVFSTTPWGETLSTAINNYSATETSMSKMEKRINNEGREIIILEHEDCHIYLLPFDIALDFISENQLPQHRNICLEFDVFS